MKNINNLLITTLITLFISACHSQIIPTDNKITSLNNDNSYAYAKITPNGKYSWADQWNLNISDAIDSHGTSLIDESVIPAGQMNTLCPGFYGAQPIEKKAVWALLFASIARYESGFDPNARFQEGPDLHYIFSEGLLQLSYGDEKNHKDCPIDKSLNNILFPEINLQCGVAIMRDQLRVRKVIFTDKHYYWSVLTNKKAEITAFFKKHVDQLPFCNKLP
jgi:hypothetical protein